MSDHLYSGRSCRRGERGSLLIGLVSVLFVLLLATVSAAYLIFGKVVPPDFIGVRQNYFSFPGVMSKGYQDRGLPPGLHWAIPGLTKIHLIPRDFQVINLHKGGEGGDLIFRQLEIPTTDGSKVLTDITLVVRFFDSVVEGPAGPVVKSSKKTEADVPVVSKVEARHGGPRELVNTFTTSKQKQLNTFAQRAEDYLKRSLSTLSTTDYYNPAMREKAAVDAQERINEAVNPDGIELWAALIRRYVYSERNIDDQIFAKNLQEQTERLNAAQSALAAARAKTEETRASWDADIKVLKDQGAAKVRIVTSEGARYKQEKVSEGDKLVELASAGVEREKNTIYAGPGGDTYIARQMLPLLSTLSGGLVTGIDPFDLQAWVSKLKTISQEHGGAANQPAR